MITLTLEEILAIAQENEQDEFVLKPEAELNFD
jgi:hypothetical protein